jgi:WD40 repeat protein
MRQQPISWAVAPASAPTAILVVLFGVAAIGASLLQRPGRDAAEEADDVAAAPSEGPATPHISYSEVQAVELVASDEESDRRRAAEIAAGLGKSGLMLKEQVDILAHWTEGVRCVAFSPDGTTLATSVHDITLWDAQTGRQKLRWSPPRTDPFSCTSTLAYSPDGKLIAAGTRERLILWDARTGQQLAVLTPEAESALVLCLAFSPDGRSLASAQLGEPISLWDVQARRKVAVLAVDIRQVLGLAFSKDGKLLLSGGGDVGHTDDRGVPELKLWDLETYTLRAKLEGRRALIREVVFTPDGETACSACENRIERWSVRTGQKLTSYASRWAVSALCFSPGGDLLVSGHFDGTILLRNTTEGKVLAQLSGHAERVTSLAFAPDGQTLASASMDATVKLWSVPGILDRLHATER